MTEKPEIRKDPMYQLLREGKIEEFNAMKAQGAKCNLTCCDFRALNLGDLDARGLDFSNSYFRQADIRGIDFRKSRLEGATLLEARISGAYFPSELTPEEITLSVTHGTRMRYSKRKK